MANSPHEDLVSAIASLLIRVAGVYLAYSSMANGVSASSDSNPTVKKHLLVHLFEFAVSGEIVRNATGHRIGVKGASPLLLDWICQRYGYEYEYTNLDNVKFFEDNGPKSPGIISYAANGQVDVIMTVTAKLSQRLKYLDFVHSWFYAPIECLVPMPEAIDNGVYAVLKPFRFWVWILLITTIIVVTSALLGLNYLFVGHRGAPKDLQKNQETNEHRRHCLIQSGTRQLAIRGVYVYVLGILLNQGGYLANKMAAVRFIIGTWCLLSLVLLNVYNGTLVSYMTAPPRAVPLISNIEDVINNANLHIVVVKGLGIDITFSATDKGLYKQLGDKLNDYSKSRCNITQQCVDLVKSVPHQHIYVSVRATLLSILQQDYAKTRQCSLTITATVPSVNIYGWTMAKRNPHLENFNRGTLNAIENGLTEIWQRSFQPNARPCYEDEQGAKKNQKQGRARKTLDRLTLGNLAGAFALLGFGSLLSIVSFVLEIVYFRLVQLKRNKFVVK